MKQHKRGFRSLLAVLMTVAMVLSMVGSAFAAEGEKHITILGTSDMHGNIWGYSYEDMKESAADGMARVSTYVNEVRKENPNTILVDAGDTIQGTILTDDLYNKSADPHPVVAAMNYMKYDAWTLGNHEFNWGVDNLKVVMGQSNAPVLAANIKNADGSLFTGSAYTIVERDGVKVAIIGVNTPNVPRWDGTKNGIADLTFESMADAVAAAIKEIGDKADVIMVSAHAGYEAEYSTDGADAAKVILEKNPEVDVLQMGHTHSTYINNDGPVPIGEARSNAAEVVRWDLTLDAENNITSAKAETVSMKGVEPDQGLRDVAAIKAAQEKTVSYISDNVLGHASADFQPVNEIRGIPAGRIQDTAVIDLIGAVQLEYSGADVTAVALFKDSSDLKKGDLNYGNIFDIYKYPNVLYTVKVTGAEMKAYMEWAAECYNQWVPGDVTISFNPGKAGYLHDHFIGLNYEINLSKSAGERIENVTFKGAPLTDDMELTLCVNDYRFSGLKTAGIISGEKDWESPQSVRDMIVEYLSKHDPLDPVVDNNWSITGVDLQLENPARAAYIAKVNAGELATPYSRSYNLDAPNNVFVDGKIYSAATATAEGETYYRLRDIAVALKGTDAAFNVEWTKAEGVVITKGDKYVGADLPMAEAVAGNAAQIGITLDGNAATMDAVAVNGNYYVTTAFIESALGATSSLSDGVLTLTAQPAASTSGQGG